MISALRWVLLSVLGPRRHPRAACSSPVPAHGDDARRRAPSSPHGRTWGAPGRPFVPCHRAGQRARGSCLRQGACPHRPGCRRAAAGPSAHMAPPARSEAGSALLTRGRRPHRTGGLTSGSLQGNPRLLVTAVHRLQLKGISHSCL